MHVKVVALILIKSAQIPLQHHVSKYHSHFGCCPDVRYIDILDGVEIVAVPHLESPYMVHIQFHSMLEFPDTCIQTLVRL